MNLEEKLHKELDWLTIKHIDADGIIRNILSICKPEIAEACKKQREICAIVYNDNKPIDIDCTRKILNAPSPLDEVK